MDDIVPPLALLERFERHLREAQDLHVIALAREGWGGVAEAMVGLDLPAAVEAARAVARQEQELADPEWRRGGAVRTVTGRLFWPLDPRPEDVEPLAVAHGLAGKGRFGCQGVRFYSVGAHSLRVRRLAEELARRAGLDVRLAGAYGLIHDGNEAFLPDVPAPIKPFIPGWADIEMAVQDAIHARLGLGALPFELADVVDEADRIALGIESRVLYPDAPDHPGVYPSDPVLLELGRVDGMGELGLWWSKAEVRDRLMAEMRQVCPRFELEEDTTQEPEPTKASSWLHEITKPVLRQAAADLRAEKWRRLLADEVGEP